LGEPADREAQPSQPCRALPGDLPRLAAWGTACRMPPGVMASTGVAWMPLFQSRATRGFAVALVHARHAQHVPGRPQTDRCDWRWVPKGHPSGVGAPSFRPPAAIWQRRRRRRHRAPLIPRTVKPRQPMPKAREQMHLPLHHVMRARPGGPGRRLRRAIVAGERDPHACATSRDSRIPSRADTMATALAGDCRADHGCTRPPSLALYDCTHTPMAACAPAIARVRGPFASLREPDAPPAPPTPAPRHPHRTAPAFALRAPLARLPGVDRPPGPGLPALTIHPVLSAVGRAMSPWPTDQHCASWRGRCPAHQLRGGTGLSTGSRPGHNRASRALRMAAQSLRTSPSSRGALSRRPRSKLGPAQATPATAPPLAPRLEHLRQEKTPYRERGAA
jgi:transposase